MQRLFILLIYGLFVSICYAADSSEHIFDDKQVFTYEFSFYTSSWQDSLEYYKENNEVYMPARLLFRNKNGDSVRIDSIGLRYKGNSSYQLAANSKKKPLKICIDEYRPDQRFFGLKKLNFSNAVMDPSFMREKISYDIARAYMPAPRTAYANVYLEGELIGLYVVIEQEDKTFLKRHFSNNDGNLYKSCDDGASLTFHDANQSSYIKEYSLNTNEKQNDWSGFISMLDKLNNSSDSEFITSAGNKLNLDNCIRHLAFTMVLSNFDSYTGTGRNYYLYDDPSSKQFFIMPWDLNLSFGALPFNWNVKTMDIVNISNLAQRPLNRRIIDNDSLRQVYFKYLLKMINNEASYDSIAAATARIRAVIEASVRADTNKFYSDTDFITNIDSDIMFRDGATKTVIPGIKSFSTARNSNINNQLEQILPVRPGEFQRRIANSVSGLYARDQKQNVMIQYEIGKNVPVQILILSMQGQTVKCINEGIKSKGTYLYSFSKKSFSPGLYIINLSAGEKNISGRLLVCK